MYVLKNVNLSCLQALLAEIFIESKEEEEEIIDQKYFDLLEGIVVLFYCGLFRRCSPYFLQ
jgi:hypothetical protein